jgi:hypothetical protein
MFAGIFRGRTPAGLHRVFANEIKRPDSLVRALMPVLRLRALWTVLMWIPARGAFYSRMVSLFRRGALAGGGG